MNSPLADLAEYLMSGMVLPRYRQVELLHDTMSDHFWVRNNRTSRCRAIDTKTFYVNHQTLQDEILDALNEITDPWPVRVQAYLDLETV